MLVTSDPGGDDVDADDRAQVRSTLMTTLDWPVTAGEVEGAAGAVAAEWRDPVTVAASRLPDDGSWTTIDELWDDLDPLLKEAVHGL